MIGLSIDPGLSTGVCLFEWSETEPIRVLDTWQFGHGAAGLSAFLDEHNVAVSKGVGKGSERLPRIAGKALDSFVVERFTPRQNEMFAHTRESVESLRGEGALISRQFMPFIEWAEPSQQYFMGGSDLPLTQKKKLARDLLRRHGLHSTGKSVGQKDADDAISATLHAVAYLRRARHRPTLEALFS